jgi:hypothetical protein
LPNVQDEPRRHLARRVPHSELDSVLSLESAFVARGVTDVGVGSGVLFGEAGNVDAGFKMTLGARGKLQETNAWERQTLNLASGYYARRRVKIALPGSAATRDLHLT